MDLGLPLNPVTLPFSCYPATPQALIDAAFSLGSARATELEGMVISDTTPSPENQGKAWYKTVSGFPVMVFIYAGAQWIALHPSPPNGNERRLWVGAEADLVTFDGGDAGPDGNASGAMWEVDADFLGRSPMGPGLIPNTGETLDVGENFGEGKHVLTQAELPNYQVKIPYPALKEGSGQVAQAGGPAVGSQSFPPNTGELASTAIGSDTPHNTVHPVRGAYIIKRTGRLYYRG